jgi:hypothetical protein
MDTGQTYKKIASFNPGAYLFVFVVIGNIFLQKALGPDIGSGNFGDAGQYLKSAEAIYNSTQYPRILEEWPTFRMPGYPFLISILWKATLVNSIVVIKLFNAICVGVVATIIYKLANRHLTSNYSLFAGILIGFNPFVYLQSTEVSTEVITMTLFLLFVYILTGRNFTARSAILSILVASLTFIRPEYLFISLPILMWSAFKSDKRYLNLLIVLVIVGTPLHIWGLQNQRATGSYLFSNSGNFQLWMGTTETIKDNYRLSFENSKNFSQNQFLRLKKEIIDVQQKHSFTQSSQDVDRQSNIWFQEFKSSVLADPLDYIKNVIYKGVVFWRPFLNPQSYSRFEVFGSLLVFLASYIVTLLGVIVSLRRRVFYREIYVFLFSFVSLTIIHAIQMPDLRYRITMLEPFSAIMISVAMFAYVKTRTSRH